MNIIAWHQFRWKQAKLYCYWFFGIGKTLWKQVKVVGTFRNTVVLSICTKWNMMWLVNTLLYTDQVKLNSLYVREHWTLSPSRLLTKNWLLFSSDWVCYTIALHLPVLLSELRCLVLLTPLAFGYCFCKRNILLIAQVVWHNESLVRTWNHHHHHQRVVHMLNYELNTTLCVVSCNKPKNQNQFLDSLSGLFAIGPSLSSLPTRVQHTTLKHTKYYASLSNHGKVTTQRLQIFVNKEQRDTISNQYHHQNSWSRYSRSSNYIASNI